MIEIGRYYRLNEDIDETYWLIGVRPDIEMTVYYRGKQCLVLHRPARHLHGENFPAMYLLFFTPEEYSEYGFLMYKVRTGRYWVSARERVDEYIAEIEGMVVENVLSPRGNYYIGEEM